MYQLAILAPIRQSVRYSEADALATLETVVSEINYLLSFLKEQSKPGNNGEDGGPLHGDHFIRYTESKIKNLTSTAIAGYDDEEIYLSSFGVVTELDGTLSIDEARFREYFDSNPEHFAAVTTSMIRTSDAGVTGVRQRIYLPRCLWICADWRHSNINRLPWHDRKHVCRHKPLWLFWQLYWRHWVTS